MQLFVELAVHQMAVGKELLPPVSEVKSKRLLGHILKQVMTLLPLS